MKVKFTCRNCSESFTIDLRHLKTKGKITCPNCNIEFPQDKLKGLIDVVSKVDDFQNSLFIENELGEDQNTWLIDVLSSKLEFYRPHYR